MGSEGLGKIAGKWLKAKADELLTTDNRTRDDAAYRVDEAERDAQEEAGRQAVFAAVPGLRDVTERQEATRRAREAEAQEEVEAELRRRPLAGVGLKIVGTPTGEFSGHLPVKAEVLPAGRRDGDPDTDWVDPDPYLEQPTLRVEVGAIAGERPMFDDLAFGGWTIVVPGYAGDGAYDLVAIHRRREEADAFPEYLDWALWFDEGGEMDLYFSPDAGPSTVTVADGGTSITVAMTAASAAGESTIAANLRLSVPPAPTA